MTLRQTTRLDIDSAIAAGIRPQVPRSGIGLELRDGRKRKVLISAGGQATRAGLYYYDKSGMAPPRTFDFAQEPQRRGRSLFVRMLDGSQRRVSTFDAVSKEFKPTALGRKFLANRTVRYTVLFPASIDLTRKNGSVFTREGDWMPSTAVDLGELEVSAALSDAEQRAEVKRIAEEWLAGRDDIDGEKILLAGYETHRYDPSRQIQFNKLSYNQAGEAQAVMHRPLYHGKPWAFQFGTQVVEEALEESDGCVAHQLSKYIRLKGLDKGVFTKEQLARELQNAMAEEYEGCEENEDLLEQSGITSAAIRRVCEAHGIPFQIFWAGGELQSFNPPKARYDAIACIVWADHLYTMQGTNAPAMKQNGKDWVMAAVQRKERKTRGYTSWELFTKIEPGEFYSRDLEGVRRLLHEQYVCPRVARNGMGKLKSLCYNDCLVHAVPKEADVCVEFLAQLARRRPHGVVYRGESFAGFGQQVFDALCSVDPRLPPTYLERQAVLARSNGKCELCGDPVDQYNLDHHVPRTAFGKDEMGNLWCVCPACHKHKTANCDNQRINVEDQNPFISRFNDVTWRAFVEAPRPHQMVADVHSAVQDNSPLYHVDIRSCRLNALTECNVHEVPVFSVLDEVEAVTGYHLGDYHWVEVPPCRLRSPLRSYAYDTARWYTRAECQFMFEHGICQWEDLKLTLTATAHRPAKDLAQKLKFMQEVWTHTAATPVGQGWAGKRAAKVGLLAKSALLSMIGAWGRTEQWRHTTVTTNHPDDCIFEGEVSTSPTPGSSVFQDITWKQRVRSQATLLPLSLIARSLERLNVARCIAVCLKHVRPERILSIQVDAVCVNPPRKRARQLWEELDAIRYNTVHEASRRPLARYAGPIQDSIPSAEKIYQIKQLSEPMQPGGTIEVRKQVSEKISDLEVQHIVPNLPAIASVAWQVETEPTRGADTMHERIVQHVAEGHSCLLTGGPGTGKSHLVRSIRAALLDQGHEVEVLAPSNAAARIVQGSTIHAFLTRISASQNGWDGTLIIDEISMVSLALCAVLEQLHSCGTRIIATGDFSQLPPVGNSWRGTPVAPDVLKDSALLWRWSEGTHFVLTRCRRSDAAHFKFYMTLPQSVKAAVAKVRAQYPTSNEADLHLTISHRRRRAINSMQQLRFTGAHGVEVPEHDGEPSYWCAAGTPLVGSCTGRAFVNGAFYSIQSVSGNSDGWKVRVQDTLTEQVLEVTPEALSKHTCLAHAIVYNRAQGATVRDKTIACHDLDSKWFSRAHLYVGLSRVTDGSSIRIAHS